MPPRPRQTALARWIEIVQPEKCSMGKFIVEPVFAQARRLGACAVVVGISLITGPAVAEQPAPAEASEVGSVWWSEIVSSDPARSREFYSSVFGWVPKIVSAEDTSRAPAGGEAEYTIYSRSGVEVAGGASADAKTPEDSRPGWVNYIEVANVDLAVMEAVKKGGKIVKPPYDEPDSGRFAVIQDPEGIVVGLVAPASKSPSH
jgi:predicted enzyme related to lactoylglutathione lyase